MLPRGIGRPELDEKSPSVFGMKTHCFLTEDMFVLLKAYYAKHKKVILSTRDHQLFSGETGTVQSNNHSARNLRRVLAEMGLMELANRNPTPTLIRKSIWTLSETTSTWSSTRRLTLCPTRLVISRKPAKNTGCRDCGQINMSRRRI